MIMHGSNMNRDKVRQKRGMVEMMKDGIMVGMGIIDDSIKCGMELNHLKLIPSEAAIHVSHVVDDMVWTGEVIGARLGQCLGKTIRWKRSLLRTIGGQECRTNACSSGGQNCSFSPGIVSQYNIHKGEMEITSSGMSSKNASEAFSVELTSPTPQTSETSVGNAHFINSLPLETSKKYSMQNQRTIVLRAQERSKAETDKVGIARVRAAIKKGGCEQNCLRHVSERYLLGERYMAWGQKYEASATWILQMLNKFFMQMKGTRKYKFITKLDGIVVCNACYVVALGYSQKRFKQLKKCQQIYTRIVAVRRNVHKKV